MQPKLRTLAIDPWVGVYISPDCLGLPRKWPRAGGGGEPLEQEQTQESSPGSATQSPELDCLPCSVPQAFRVGHWDDLTSAQGH